MDAGTRRTMQDMVVQLTQWVKTLAEDSQQVRTPGEADALERRVREEGLKMLGGWLESLLQNALDHQPDARTCPCCGKRRRHKGTRSRGLLSSVGAIRLSGTYWYCSDCGGQHAADALARGSASAMMRQMLCLLGTAMSSFAKADLAASKLLGVRVSENYIRRLCEAEGRQVDLPPPEVPQDRSVDVTGSCDGTMVHTRQDGWKELKAFRFSFDGHAYGRAYLEPSNVFLPRIRRAALAMHVGRADHLFWVADAAAWIEKGLTVQWPDAIQIVDYWHACQHVHEAARGLFGEGTPKAKQWARRYCEELRTYGGWALWNSLRRVRYKNGDRQAWLDALLGYLERNADRMDYPTYERAGWPIGSGPMESYCKQLGQRLKGPGMRWSRQNIAPMATLVSLWANGDWDRHWQTAA
jgi:hypothetical protein